MEKSFFNITLQLQRKTPDRLAIILFGSFVGSSRIYINFFLKLYLKTLLF